jgi:hypothetical protein
MEDYIDIIVTETTNTIEITSQGTDEVIDVNIIDNRDDIVLNVTPSVVEININSLTSNFGVAWGQITGTLSNQTDLNTALGLKADLVGGKVPSSQLPSYVDDVIEVANYAALPATGETGKIYVTLDTNYIYRWTGSVYVEIKDSSAVWGAITGTLSNQTDLQNALNAKFDDPTGDTTQYIAGDGSLVTFPIAGQAGTLVREVRNTTGATLTKGTIVYILGATGNKPTVSKAIATGDSTSAQTFGMLQTNIANNANGYAVCSGDLSGLDTSALTEGQQLYLSGVTAGAYTTTKSVAPIHLVYIGVVTRSHPTQGQIEVKIQNGYELDEIHDVLITSKANNDGLFYESSTSLWKNKSIATVLGYTPANAATYVPYTGATSDVILGVNKLKATSVYAEGSGGGGGALQIKQYASASINEAGYSSIGTLTSGIFYFASATTAPNFKNFALNPSGLTDNTLRTYALPDASGTIALTSDLHNAVTLGTANGLSLSTQVLSLGLASGSTNGALSSTDWTTFNGKQNALSGTGFVKSTAGTISYDTSTYALDSSVVHNTGAETISGIKYFFSGSKHDLLFVSETVGYASIAGYSHFKANTNHVEFINSTNTKATKFIHGNAAYEFTMPNASGTIALTSNLSSYLPLSGGTLTGALSGTSATFTSLSLSNTDGYLGTINSSGANGGYFEWRTSGTTIADIGTAQQIFGSGGSTTFGINARGARSLIFGTNNTARFTLDSSGAATFSSSITANSTNGVAGVFKSNTFFGSIDLENTGGDVAGKWNVQANSGAQVGGSSGSSFGIYSYGASAYRFWISSAGNVGIGTTAPNQSGTSLALSINSTNPILELNISNARNGYLYTDGTEVRLSSVPAIPLTFFTNNTERMRITSGGDVFINSTSTINSEKLFVKQSSSSNLTGIAVGYGTSANQFRSMSINSSNIMTFNNGTNEATLTAAGAWSNASDARLKKNIENIKYGLDTILQSQPRSYNRKDVDGDYIGFVAQELMELIPEVVSGDSNSQYCVDYGSLVAVAFKAIKDLKQELDLLKNK